MTERPILFSAPMVLALLAGRKTQTRRLIKPQPTDYRASERSPAPQALAGQPPKHPEPYLDSYNRTDRWCWWDEYDRQGPDWIRCPYGVVGDRLWVREAFTRVPASAYRMSEGVQQTVNPHDRDEAAIYRAGWDRSIPKWKPGIHLPRWASRLSLLITDVRVERLQDISEADAIAEGLYKSLPDDEDRAWFDAHFEDEGRKPTPGEWEQFEDGVWMVPGVPQGWGMTPAERRKDTWGPTPQFCYRLIWEHINGKGSWDANPWVWAVSFEVEGRP